MTLLSADASGLLRGILADPAIPISSLASLPGARRISALREALDHLKTVRAGAAAAQPGNEVRLLTELARIDTGLSDALRWHSTLTALLASLMPGPARNAVLGDVHRGALLTWAIGVDEWRWDAGVPDASEPNRRASITVRVEHYPGLYDSVLVWDRAAGVIAVVPTHRTGLHMRAARNADSWLVQGSGISFHVNELIPAPADPRQSAAWREYPRQLSRA